MVAITAAVLARTLVNGLQHNQNMSLKHISKRKLGYKYILNIHNVVMYFLFYIKLHS